MTGSRRTQSDHDREAISVARRSSIHRELISKQSETCLQQWTTQDITMNEVTLTFNLHNSAFIHIHNDYVKTSMRNVSSLHISTVKYVANVIFKNRQWNKCNNSGQYR